MANDHYVACGSCGNRVHEPQARTCPHCLQALDARHFGSREALSSFQQDRKAHGTHVEPVEKGPSVILAMAVLAAGTLMTGAGALILVMGLWRGGPLAFTNAAYDAALPLAMGLTMAGIGFKMGGWT